MEISNSSAPIEALLNDTSEACRSSRMWPPVRTAVHPHFILFWQASSASNCWLSDVNICVCVLINPCILKSFPVVASDISPPLCLTKVCLEENQKPSSYLVPFGRISSRVRLPKQMKPILLILHKQTSLTCLMGTLLFNSCVFCGESYQLQQWQRDLQRQTATLHLRLKH